MSQSNKLKDGLVDSLLVSYLLAPQTTTNNDNRKKTSIYNNDNNLNINSKIVMIIAIK